MRRFSPGRQDARIRLPVACGAQSAPDNDNDNERLWMNFSLGIFRRGAAATAGSLAVVALTAAAPLQAADTTARDLAASCAACHGTDGNAVGRMAVLAGQDRAVIIEKLNAFRTGGAGATVMHQHAKGYSDAEIGLIADYFSTRTRAER